MVLVGIVTVRKLGLDNICLAADLMVQLKPNWWDIKGACEQLGSGTGWILEEDGVLKGWLLGHYHFGYKTFEIECLGYNLAGEFSVGPELDPLLDTCEAFAIKFGAILLSFIIGSNGLSCHESKLSEPGRELTNLSVMIVRNMNGSP